MHVRVHTCKYSYTAAAGEEVRPEDARSVKVTPDCGRETLKDYGQGGCRSACPDKWLHFSPAITNVLTH